jgi:hypothetical protein
MFDHKEHKFRRMGFSTRRLLLALLALLLAAAWVEPLLVHRAYPRQIDIGGHDLGLAQGWSAKEISETLPSAYGPVTATYRWSAASSELVFAPAARGQPYVVTMRLLSGRSDDQPVSAALAAEGRSLGAFAVAPTLRRYHVLAPGALAGSQSLTMRLDTPTFTPPDDERILGLIGLDAWAVEAGAVPWLPRPALPLFLAGLAALLLANGLTLRQSVVGAALALALALAAGLAAPAATLAAARTLAQLFLIAALVAGIARWWRGWGAVGGQGWGAVGGHGGPPLQRPIRRFVPRRPWRWAAAGLILLAILLFTPGMSADGVEYYAYVRSLAVDGDIEFTNEFKDPAVPFERVPEWLATNRSPTGYAQNLASVGPAIVWAPLYLVGSLVARAGNVFGAGWTTDGYSLPYIALVNLAGVVSLPITVWLCYLIARRVAGHGIALLSAITLVAGSAIVDYGLFEAHFPHALAAMTVAGYFAWWLRTRPERTLAQWVVLGLLAGAMALMYWINAILLLLPALDLLPPFARALRSRDWRALGGMVGGGLTFVAALLLAFSPQMVAWTILYGSPLTIPHGGSFAEPSGFKVLEMLFSPVHGQLLWAPITIVALVGMGWYVARRPWEASLALLAFALYFMYNATLGSWHGGGPFGLRRIANVLPLLTPGLACLLVWLGRLQTTDHQRPTNDQRPTTNDQRRMQDRSTKTKEQSDDKQSAADYGLRTTDYGQLATWPLTLCALCLTWNAALLLRYLTYLIPHHPSELGTLTIGEFVLAPNNLPWFKLGPVVGNALFPRLLVQGLSNPSGGEWAPFALLLGATLLILAGTAAAVAWLHGRAQRVSIADPSQTAQPPRAQSAQGI